MTKRQRWITITQWAVIVVLVAICLSKLFDGCGRHKSDVMDSRLENSYVRMYDSQEIENLKAENRSLYDSIAHLKNVESAIEIKYVIKERIDTVLVSQFVQEEFPDSTIYHFTQDNDTVKWDVDICAKDLKWYSGKVDIHQNFRLINVSDGDRNTLTFQHPSNVEVEDMTVWHQKTKRKWTDRFHVGPQIGVGYGFFNGRPDVYVGFGATYELW